MKSFKPVDELKIGQIIEVTGTKMKVEISGNIAELTRSYDGRVYPIGQIGSVVKVHFGRRIIFGFVTLLRMRSDELLDAGIPVQADADQRLMEVEMFAEGAWSFSKEELSFHRGIKTYPLPRQGVYLLTRDEATFLYQAAEGERDDIVDPLIPFAKYSGTEGTLCRANIDKMFGMHCALLGSTGSGKSGAVAALLHSILEHNPVENRNFSPQIVIIDPHGEYGSAFGDRANIYRAYEAIGGEELPGKEISLPYWLMSADEFRTLVIGKTEYEATSQNNIIYKALTHARMVAAGIVDPAPPSFGWETPSDGQEHDEPRPAIGVDPIMITTFDRDKPRPFSLIELENHIRFVQAGRDQKGLIQSVTATDFAKNFRSVLDKLAVLQRDPRISFLMKERDTKTDLNLAQILAQFVGASNEEDELKKDIRIVDISGLPNEVAGPLTAAIARLLFQYKVYQTQTEREQDPLLIVCEEAHRYVPNQGEAQYAVAQTAVRRIAREGRKYGIGLLLVSQRPADIESTVIAQCGTWLVLRLTNAADQQHVSRFLPDGLSGMVSALPALAQQEALFVGEGAALPARIRIRDLPEEKLPRSANIPFAGGWSKNRLDINELNLIAKRMDGTDNQDKNSSKKNAVPISETDDDIPF